MVALQLAPTENIAWLQFLCWTCRLSEWLSGGYGQGRCLEFCPFESYGATLNIETWRALTIEAQPSNVTCPSVTAPPVEAFGFDETMTTTTDGWAETMPYTIHVDTTGFPASPSITSKAMVVYIRTEQQAPARGFFSSCLSFLWSLLLILWNLLFILKSIVFDPIDTCKLFVLRVYEVCMAFMSGIDTDTLRLNVALVVVILLLLSLYSAALALPGRAIKGHKSIQAHFPLSDQIMQLQTQLQETQTSRDGLQDDLDDQVEKNKKLTDTHSDTLAKINARITELEDQLEREQAETKKAKDERTEKDHRILGLEAEIKEEQELLEKTNSSKKALRDGHEEQMTQLQATHEANVSELSAAYESKIKALKSTHDEELDKIENDRESTRLSRDELRGQLAQLKATHESELDEAHKAVEKAKRDLEAAHKLELDNVRGEAGKELKQLKATHAQEKQVLEHGAKEARTARGNEIAEQKSLVDKLKLELASEKAAASDARRQVKQQHADNAQIRKAFEDQEKAAKAMKEELKEAGRESNRLQYKLDQLEGSQSFEAMQREKTESRLKADRDTADNALQIKTGELKQAKEEIARLRLQLKESADEQRGSSVPGESPITEETTVPVEESSDDSLFGESIANLDPVVETQEAPVYTSPEWKADAVDSAAISAQLLRARDSNHVLKRVELEPISLLQDLNPPFQSVLEQVETRVLGSQKGALVINSDPRRPDYYLRGDSFPAKHVKMMSDLDRAMRDKTNERFGLIETVDRSKEGGYRYSMKSGFLGSRRRKSIAIGETDAYLLAEVGWRVPGRPRSVFKLAAWSSGFSAQSMLERKRTDSKTFEKKMGMKDNQVADLSPEKHRHPTDAFFTAKPALTLSSEGQGLTSPASLTDILGLEDLRQQQIERGHATQFSRLSSNALLDKSRSTWSKRQAGDLMSTKEVRVELFMKHNNRYNSTLAKSKKICDTSGPDITGRKTPSLSAGKSSGTPAAASKSNGMYSSRYAPSKTSSGSSIQTQADGPGVSSNTSSPALPASRAAKRGNSMNDSNFAPKLATSTPSVPAKVGSDSSSSKLDPSAASFAPSLSGKKIDMDSSKSAPSTTPSAPNAANKGSDLNDSQSTPPAPAPSASSAPTKKANDLSASSHATPSAASVSSSPAATNGSLFTSKSADTSATSVPSGPKTANGMSASRYAPKSTQSASNPSTEKASDLSVGKSAPSSNASPATPTTKKESDLNESKSAPSSNASDPTPTTKKANDMYSSRYATPSNSSATTAATNKESDSNKSKPAPSSNASVPDPPTKKANGMFSSMYAPSSSAESSSTTVAADTTSNSSAGAVPTAPRAQSQSGSFNARQWGGTFNLNYARDPNEASESEDSNPRGRGRGGRGRGRGRARARARGRYTGRRR